MLFVLKVRRFIFLNRFFSVGTLGGLLRFFVFVLIIIPILLFFTYEYHELQLTRQQTSEQIQRVLSMQHKVIDDWFEQQSSHIRILSMSKSVKNLDKNGMILIYF